MNKYISIISLIMFIGGGRVFAQAQLGSDIDGEAAYDESGYSVSINSDGDRVAIGAPYNDGSDPDAGHVRVIEIGSVTISGNSGFRMMSSQVAGQV